MSSGLVSLILTCPLDWTRTTTLSLRIVGMIEEAPSSPASAPRFFRNC
jgi:hypothetical protein